MNPDPISRADAASLLLACVFALGWLATGALSLAFRLARKQRQTYRIPWWGAVALALALLVGATGRDGFSGHTMYLVSGVVVLLYGLFAGYGVGFRPFGEFRWWNPHILLPSAEPPSAARAETSAEAAEEEPPAGRRQPIFARARLEDDPRSPRALFYAALTAISVALSLGFGALTTYQTLRWLRAEFTGELGFGGLVFLFLAFIAGVLGAVLCAAVLSVPVALAMKRRSGPALLIFLALGALGVFLIHQGMVRPVRDTNRAEAEKKAQALAAVSRENQLLRRQWLDGLRAKGMHGPLGETPPMLEVQDEGATVRLTYRGETRTAVQIDRIRREGERWSRCRLTIDYHPYIDGSSAYLIDPGASLVFVADAACAAGYREAPLEYRVGHWGFRVREPGYGSGWWSDSALEEALRE